MLQMFYIMKVLKEWTVFPLSVRSLKRENSQTSIIINIINIFPLIYLYASVY